MKTQVFYSPDDGLAAGDPAALPSAGAAVAERPPAPPSEPSFELPPGYELEDEPQAGGPTSAQLAADYKKALEENTALKARPDPTAAFAVALGEFKSGLEKLANRPVQVQAQMPQAVVDPDVDEKTFDDGFLEAPMKNIRKLLGREITPALELTIKSNISTAKALVRERVTERPVFDKYGPEIDVELSKIPLRELVDAPVEGIERALAVVKGRHLDEIIAAEREKWQAAPAAGAAAAPVVPPQPLARGQVLPGSPMAPRESGVRGIKASELAKVKAYMDTNGVPSDKFDAVLANVRDGTIK